MPSHSALVKRRESQKIYTAVATLARPVAGGGLEYKTVRFATGYIPPAMAAHYYPARLAGLPAWQRRMQEVFSGSSMRSFGNIDLVNVDRGVSADLSEWTWAGQPVTLFSGFPELGTLNYEPLYTARMGQPQHSNDRYRIPVEDFQKDLFNATLAAGDYADTVPNLVDALLTAAGITAKDTARWADWAAANNFNAWFRATGDDSVADHMDKLVPPLCCQWGFNRAGEFDISTISPAAGTPLLTLTDRELLDFGLAPWQADRLYKLTIEYLTTTGDSPEYGEVVRQDADIKTLDGGADDDTIRTCLTSATDAGTVADRHFTLKSPARKVRTATTKLQTVALQLGDTVQIDRGRADCDGLYLVAGYKDSHATARITTELFG